MPNNIIGERSTAPQNIVGILRNVGSGRGIASIDLDSGCHLVVTYTDGTTWTSDETLRGITATAVTDEYKLRITYEDGTVWESTQSIRGPVGPSTDTKVGELEDLTTVEKGTAVGAINELDAKGKKAADSAYQLLSKKTTEDTDPYLFRRTPEGVGDRADDTIVGGTVAWNQLVRNGNFADTSWWTKINCTISASNNVLSISAPASETAVQCYQMIPTITGHKYLVVAQIRSNAALLMALRFSNYYTKKSLVDSTAWTEFSAVFAGNRASSEYNFYFTPDSNIQVDAQNAMCIDLTQMFGSTIADYIYSLEQETAGAGVAWFKKYFPADYYPYNAGELVSVKPTAKVTRGFNQWDEEWEIGGHSSTTGEKLIYNDRIRSKNYISIIGDTTYYKKTPELMAIYFYDANKKYISMQYWSLGNVFTTPTNARYMALDVSPNYGTTYNHDICINISDDSKNGTYEPYVGRTYPLGAEVRGIISLSNGKLAFNNGDIYTPDGKVQRKYGIVDLGTLNWDYSTRGCFYVRLGDAKERNNHLSNTYANIICNKYPTCTNSQGYNASIDKAISLAYWNAYPYLSVTDTSYGTDAAAFKTAMSDVYLLYELATPTTEQSLPYDSPQVIFPEGTEQYVDDRTVPLIVGHITTYHTDMRNKLESLPDSTLEYWEVGSADQLTTKLGDTDQASYLYRQSGGDLTVGTREYDTLVGGTVAENQLVQNGNFEADTGWTYTSVASHSVSNNTLSFTASAKEGLAYRGLTPNNIIGGHKYLCYAHVKLTTGSTDIYLQVRNGNGVYDVKRTENLTSWQELSGIMNGVDYTLPYVRVLDNRTNGWDTIQVRNVIFTDLTQMLGSAIADYVYSLETATADSGIAWLKKYGFVDGKYHSYSAGSLLSVHPSEHKMVGFNQWDEEWELGGYNTTTGEPSPRTDTIRSKNYVDVLPSTNYYVKVSATMVILFYDADKNYIGYIEKSNVVFTTPSNARYMRFRLANNYGTTYNHDICINISDPQKNGTYEPYTEHTYTLPDADLRGIFKLDSNNLPYCDGDTDDGSGTRTRKYEIVDLGTLTWEATSAYGNVYRSNANISYAVNGSRSTAQQAPIILSTSAFKNSYNVTDAAQIATAGLIGIAYDKVYITFAEHMTAAQVKTAVSGIYMLCTLKKEYITTETSTAFTNPQVVDPDGTEEYIDERIVSVPVGHSTFYPKDLKRKLEELPDPPSGANGTYILKATINNGVTTYSWVVE